MRTAGLAAGPSLGLLVWLLNPGGHASEPRRLLAILTMAICFWVTEAIPLPATALLASSLCIVLGVAPARAVLAPYADPVIFLFVGSFLLSEAFQKYGLDRRIAAWLLRRSRFASSPSGLLAGVGITSAGISTCLSNTATAALMTPIAQGALREKSAGASERALAPPWITGVLLMVAYGASVGGMATLIGTPPNLLVAGYIERLAGVKVGFVDWLLFGAPVALTLLAVSILWTRAATGASAESASGSRHVAAPRAAEPEPDLDPSVEPEATRIGRRWTMLAFGLAGALWLLPGLTILAAGPDSGLATLLTRHLPEAGVALLCACLLFVAPVDWRSRRFALTWEDGRRVNWGIILLFGGGLSLGTLAESTGLARWAGEGLQQMGLSSTPAGLLAVSIAATILVSEFASNTAATTLLVPIVISAAQASGFDPVRPALAVGLAATCGFIFPVSTPPNAIVFGTGQVPLGRMIRVGALLDVASFIVIWFGMLALGPLLPR